MTFDLLFICDLLFYLYDLLDIWPNFCFHDLLLKFIWPTLDIYSTFNFYDILFFSMTFFFHDLLFLFLWPTFYISMSTFSVTYILNFHNLYFAWPTFWIFLLTKMRNVKFPISDARFPILKAYLEHRSLSLPVKNFEKYWGIAASFPMLKSYLEHSCCKFREILYYGSTAKDHVFFWVKQGI